MKLAVFNGSPRRENSNTKMLLDAFIEGFKATPGNECVEAYLYGLKEQQTAVELFRQVDTLLIGFPLYADSMPANVKLFIETLKPFRGKLGGKKIGFLVQSGFPEAIHSVYVEKYLKKLTQKLGCEYIGTIIKGGVEAVRGSSKSKKLAERFKELGVNFGSTGKLDSSILEKLMQPYKFTGIPLVLIRLMVATGLMTFIWNLQMKRNGSFEKRYDRPLETL